MKKLKRELLTIKILLCVGVALIGLCVRSALQGSPLFIVGLVAGVILALAGGTMMMRGYKCPHCGHPLNPKEDYLKNCPKCKQPFGE